MVERAGLVLTGGGARAAYQVGALRALAEMAPAGPVPFDVLAGISAGAINAVVVAAAATDFQRGVARLADTWRGLTPDRVFRTGAVKLVATGGRWIRDLSGGGLLGRSGINYLLDSSPLRAMLAEQIPFARLRRQLRAGRLRGVAVSATSYQTGEGVTFFEGSDEIRPWARTNRVGVRVRLTLDHVMASAAIPLFFPPVRLADGFYGDGCVRLVYPMSPAIHMGATRILAISVRAEPPREPAPPAPPPEARLPLSQIAGVMLNAVFLDSLDTDLERLERINLMLAEVPGGAIARGDLRLRPLPVLALRPSQDLGQLAEDEYHRFPGMLRYLMKGIGVGPHSGTDLLSYLAFEPIYLSRLMELGYRDTMARRDEVEAFLLGRPGEPSRVRSA